METSLQPMMTYKIFFWNVLCDSYCYDWEFQIRIFPLIKFSFRLNLDFNLNSIIYLKQMNCGVTISFKHNSIL